MATLNIYTILDAKAKSYAPPFLMHNDPMAIRAFSNYVNDPGSRIGENPEDYNLYAIGYFDDQSADITPCEPTMVAQGILLVDEDVRHKEIARAMRVQREIEMEQTFRPDVVQQHIEDYIRRISDGEETEEDEQETESKKLQ